MIYDKRNAMHVHIARCMLVILDNESQWSRVHRGEDRDGCVIEPENTFCVKWSILGALSKIRDGLHMSLPVHQVTKLAEDVYDQMARIVSLRFHQRLRHHRSLTAFNEHPDTTFEEVRTVLQECLEHFEGANVLRFDHLTKPV